MKTVNEIEIMGDPALITPRIFQLAANIQDWPTLLPHYRYMRIREQSERHKQADYGASRDGFPVKWSARQELFPETNRITFAHTAGITKGMRVEWKLEPRPHSVHVTISHDLRYPVPIAGYFFAKYIVGKLFVENIAGKTLRCIKAKVEAEFPLNRD
jgi:ribosome-associated toxin RatA of RatAB toxin-antitoxin module